MLAALLILLGSVEVVLGGLLASKQFLIDACQQDESPLIRLRMKPLHASRCDPYDLVHYCYNREYAARMTLLQGATLLALAGILLSRLRHRVRSRFLIWNLAFWGLLACTGLARWVLPERVDVVLSGILTYVVCCVCGFGLFFLGIYGLIVRCCRLRRRSIRGVAAILGLNLAIAGAHLLAVVPFLTCI